MGTHSKLIRSLLTALAVFMLFACSAEPERSSPAQKETEPTQPRLLAFGGGPTGGTFNFFANKMASIITKELPNIDVMASGSGGSPENLRTLNKNGVDLGIIYSGDAYLGRLGKLPDDMTIYDQVRALSFLYSAPAQLVVREDSNIHSPNDLVGKAVAVGNPGSGAALSAERFFSYLGIWSKLQHRNLGYSEAAADLIEGKIDAFWVLVGYPNASVIEAAGQVPIKLVNLHTAAEASGFYSAYPFYTPTAIPAGTYEGQETLVRTFQDAALWSACTKLNEGTVYDCLKTIYSDKGLQFMVTAHKAARDMSVDSGLNSVSIPLHPGAVRFWEEMGMTIPEELK